MWKVKNKKGFTLMELIVGMFIFVLIIGSVSHLFGSAINTKRNIGIVQDDYERAQLAMNRVAKVLRTSTIVSTDTGKRSSIDVFDYSQSKCLGFQFYNNKLQIAEDISQATVSDCENSRSFSTYKDLAETEMTGFFDIVKTVPDTVMGKVTISLKAQPDTGNVDDISRMQTTVSLRDYEEGF